MNTVLDHGFNATLDGPNNLLTIDIFKRFPKAKVLFNVRDTPEICTFERQRIRSD